MLKRNPATDLPMTQSPDVQGVTIDFGDAPAHGRWRAMSMTIWLRDRKGMSRIIGWNRWQGFYDPTGEPGRQPCIHGDRRPYERVTRIRLNTWELRE